MSERRIERALRRVAYSARSIVGRCVLQAMRDQKRQVAQVSVLDGEVRETEYFEPYGFTSVAFDGAEGVIVCPTGSRDHAITMLFGNREHRPLALAAGEWALYTDEGNLIVARRGKKLEIRAAELDAVLTGPAKVEAGGDVTVESTGGTVTIESPSEVTVRAPTVKIDASATIEAAQGATLKLVDERLFTWTTALTAWLAAHTHRHDLLGQQGSPPGSTPPVGPLAATHATEKLKGS